MFAGFQKYLYRQQTAAQLFNGLFEIMGDSLHEEPHADCGDEKTQDFGQDYADSPPENAVYRINESEHQPGGSKNQGHGNCGDRKTALGIS